MMAMTHAVLQADSRYESQGKLAPNENENFLLFRGMNRSWKLNKICLKSCSYIV